MPVLFYDLETFGVRPARDRIAEFAAVRTDDELRKREEHVSIRCVPPPDYLPTPAACLKTGITPQFAAQTGLTEPLFARRLHRIFLEESGTTIVGYNSASFDDEFVRHLMYRSLVEPYAWHSRDGNRRFDFFPLVGALYDFHRDQFSWPRDERDRPDFRLEALTLANDRVAGTAHEALADTFGLRNLCALVRERVPAVWESAFALTARSRVEGVLRAAAKALESGEVDRAVLIYSSPLLKRPERSSAPIAVIADSGPPAPSFWLWDLTVDPTELADLDPETAAASVFDRGREGPLAAITLLNPRRFPVLFEPRTDHIETLSGYGVDWNAVRRAAGHLATAPMRAWRERFARARNGHDALRNAEARDAEERLYGSFLPDSDRTILRGLEEATRRELTARDLGRRFADERLQTLSWRLRARFAPTTLTAAERAAWHREALHRLDVDTFDHEWHAAMVRATDPEDGSRRDRRILEQLAEHRAAILERLELSESRWVQQ